MFLRAAPALLHAMWLCVSIVCAYETVEDAAVIARNLVDHSLLSVGTMATVFPASDPLLSHQPFSLQEYYASCMHNGSLTLIVLPISRHARNLLENHQASISIASEHPQAHKPRVSLMGTVTLLQEDSLGSTSLKACYLRAHPDAKEWLPGDPDGAHTAYWARFDPLTVYFVGGFGDKHYIGYIPLHMYQKASQIDHGEAKRKGITGRVLVEQQY